MLAARLVERNLLYYRRYWLPFLTGFLEPVFYLFSIGVGLGTLVGSVDGIGYASYVAPAMLAASAMNGAIYDSTFGFYFKLRFTKLYDAVLATPLRPADIAIGEIAWALLRGSLYSAGFLAVMAVAGYLHSWQALLALPAAPLIGFAFASTAMAATTYMRNWQDFDLIALVQLPLFLLSATFYPLSTYDPAVRWLVQLSPLYHGVALLRGFTLGTTDVTAVGHVLFLVAFGLVGVAVTRRRLTRLLLR